MKLILALFIMLALGFTTLVASSSFAEETRTVNPGVDPNESKVSKPYEADVAAPGVCPECIARMKHNRLKDDTTFRKGAKPGSDKNEAPQKGTQ